MPSFSFALSLDPSSHVPLFVQISRAIADDVARGRLKPGDALPGTRTLAATLCVHRSTVVSAYLELAAQGWTAARPGGTTYVLARSPEVPARAAGARQGRGARSAETAGFSIAPFYRPSRAIESTPSGAIGLSGGVPDLRLLPVDLLARAYRRAARRYGHTLLGYGLDPMGHVRLRTAIAEMVSSSRGLAAREDDVMITRGSQMALDLVTRSLISPGDVVVVEALSYASAVSVFRRAGAEVLPVNIDQDGIDVAALAALARKRPVRLAYLTPHHQYPTNVVLSPTRRLALLELARREKFALVEDDYDQEFHYDGRPVLPLAKSDTHGNVIYLGTLAKILAPGLRLGYVIAPRPLLARMTEERMLIDRQGDAILECAVAELIEDGDLPRLVRRNRRIYRDRRDALCAAVDRDLGHVLSYVRPPGGLSIWAKVDASIDVETWFAECVKRGVRFQIGREFTFDGRPTPFIRIGYSSLDDATLTLVMRRMVASLRKAR